MQKRSSATLKQPTTRQAKKADVTGPDDSLAAQAASAARTAQDKASDAVASVGFLTLHVHRMLPGSHYLSHTRCMEDAHVMLGLPWCGDQP